MPLMPRRRRRPRDRTMSVVEHLDELRRRLLISLISVAVAAIVGFVFYEPILDYLAGPYRDALLRLPEEARPPGAFQRGLVFAKPTEGFLTFLKIGFFSGFLLALPIVLYQLWRFVTPGLTKRERRMAITFVGSSVLLFGGGVVFAFAILPRGLSFLLSFGGDNLVPLLTAQEYLNFLVFLILAFGLSFEFPLVLIFLAGARIITTATLRRWRRYAYFGTAVFAAIVTPTQDPYTMLLMWVPLMLLYEGAILVARLFKR
jgi:sec-independent protein translocase protein TatC